MSTLPTDTTRTSFGLRQLHSKSALCGCQGEPNESLKHAPDFHQAILSRSDRHSAIRSRPRSPLRLLLFAEPAISLPTNLLQRVERLDAGARVVRNWDSVMEALFATSCSTLDVIIDAFNDLDSALRRSKQLCNLRVRSNYSPRPRYFAISTSNQSPTVRYEIERHGGHFLHVFDVPKHFDAELEQIRLELAPLNRSTPSWLVVQEGEGATLRGVVYLVGRRNVSRIHGSDRLIAALAAFIKHNGIHRPLGAWQKVLADDALFKPAGGGFDVPSLASIKMYLRRDFRERLQETFDEQCSGFCATRVIECADPATHSATYRIRGEWELVRR